MFKKETTVIAMIHVDPLPGTPRYRGPMRTIIEKAKAEAALYRDAGVHMIAVENMHDIPYLKGNVGPEVVAAMTAVAFEVKQVSGLPCGMQILAGANCAALGAANAAGLDFIRAEGFVFAHVADEGLIEADAGHLLRYRRNIGAESVRIFADIKKKHSAHALTADVSIEETARAAAFFDTDGVIVTGTSTGVATDLDDLDAVVAAVSLPVLVGSGITLENLVQYHQRANGLIVGSYFKEDGYWANGVDARRVATFMERLAQLQT